MTRVLLLLALLLLPLAGPRAQAPSPFALCRAAIATAEREAGIPPGLLAAIGRVESGRQDPETGRNSPYPWTMNAEGTGRFFPGKAEAVAHVRQLQAQGVRSIDIGCMQINQLHHPNAFASLEEGFEPLANARYAARFLKELHATRGDWLVAAGNYHSNTPHRAEAYRAQVALRWPEEQRGAGAAPGWNPAWNTGTRPALVAGAGGGLGGAPAGGFALRGGGAPVSVLRTPSPPGGGASEGGGRGLDAYRAMAIPLATGSSALLARRG